MEDGYNPEVIEEAIKKTILNNKWWDTVTIKEGTIIDKALIGKLVPASVTGSDINPMEYVNNAKSIVVRARDDMDSVLTKVNAVAKKYAPKLTSAKTKLEAETLIDDMSEELNRIKCDYNKIFRTGDIAKLNCSTYVEREDYGYYVVLDGNDKPNCTLRTLTKDECIEVAKLANVAYSHLLSDHYETIKDGDLYCKSSAWIKAAENAGKLTGQTPATITRKVDAPQIPLRLDWKLDRYVTNQLIAGFIGLINASIRDVK